MPEIATSNLLAGSQQLCVQAAVKQLIFKMKVVLALALGASALAPSQPKVRSSQKCAHIHL